MKLKIRGKIICLVLVAALFASSIMVFSTFLRGKKSVEQAVTKVVDGTIDMLIHYTETKLDTFLQVMEELAAEDAFTGAKINTADAHRLCEASKERNGYNRVSYTDEHGISEKGSDFSQREFFVRCKESMKPVISQPYASVEHNGQYSLLFAAPIIRKDGSFGGIVYCADRAEILGEMISDLTIGEDSNVLIMDAEGNVIAAQEEGLAKAECNFLQDKNKSQVYDGQVMKEISQKMVNGESGVVLYGKNMDGRLYSYRPICQDDGWSICVDCGLGEYMMEFYQNMIIVLATFGIVAFVIIVLTIGVANHISKPIRLTTKRMEGLADGDIHTAMPVVKSKDEAGMLAESMKGTIENLSMMISKVSDTLGKMSAGDFTMSVDGEFKGDLLPVKEALNTILFGLRKLMEQISLSAAQVLSGSKDVAQLSESLASAVTQQTSIMENIKENVNKVAGEANQNADRATQATFHAQDAMGSVQEGNRQMQLLIQAMEEMEKSSQAIEQVNKTVSDIAFQTNILALNAAVEAARAGEVGKGFAVVAEEVRALAEKSAKSSDSASELIEQTVTSIKNGMSIARKTFASMDDVVVKATGVEQNIREIEKLSNQQLQALEFISKSIGELADAFTATAASSEESSATAEELHVQATMLEDFVMRFKV